ncbi:stage II sporulation protein M [Staphylococcus ursi]|uniref:stage II sporulation protein M n=1 Tax=Staphylococcus sp. MI 10-1553 TaxID=1912064 RepID=UPI001398A21C|nr:stage II sporulation protein M [Staphylococcus sp. MI 10-1553]QHW38022.1 stage II sporulation protein M [Staphylococcus sp. MI 10-1553]
MNVKKHYTILSLYIFFLLLGIMYNHFTDINDYVRVSNECFFNFNKVIHYVKNNGFVYLLLCLGLITYRVTTVINIIVNGFMLGMYFIPMIQIGGFAFLLHGIPELTALYIGAYIGFSSIQGILDDKKKYLVMFLMGNLLIVIAALIETYLTPLVF